MRDNFPILGGSHSDALDQLCQAEGKEDIDLCLRFRVRCRKNFHFRPRHVGTVEF